MVDGGAAASLEPESAGEAAALEDCLVSMEDMEDGGAAAALEPERSGATAAL